MDIINHYFPDLSERQKQQFEQLGPLCREWNSKINLISRKDIDNLYERHILHSLAISKFIHFKLGAQILDLGTGGGFPGIPLAIYFPETQFKLIDGTGKKIHVVKDIITQLSLSNARAEQVRAEELKKEKFDFVVSRAVANLDKLLLWSQRLIRREQQHVLPNGLIALKGGDIDAEIQMLSKEGYVETYSLGGWFGEDFFKEKRLVYIQMI